MSDEPKPRYKPIEIREFKSSIPPHLLDKLTPTERYFVEAISKLEGQFAWASEAVLTNSRSIQDIDSRLALVESNAKVAESIKLYVEKVDKLWDWKTLMTGKWAVIGALAMVALSVLLKMLVDLLLRP